jgi:hypothetical protein
MRKIHFLTTVLTGSYSPVYAISLAIKDEIIKQKQQADTQHDNPFGAP